MNKYIVDYHGFAIVPAESREEAEETFLQHMVPDAGSPLLTWNTMVTEIEYYEPGIRQLSMFDEE